MRLASLYSGGKDSTYATYLASRGVDEVAYLVTMRSMRDDSWMFHTVNIHLAPLVARALRIENIYAETVGEKERELEDLRRVLTGLEVGGLVTGAIASTYQRSRIDRLCNELGLKHVAPLWGMDGYRLLGEMLSEGMVMLVTAVAARGLNERWLGRILDEDALEELGALNRLYGLNVCGEGGEMETLVLDAPWFKGRLEIVKAERLWDGVRGAFLVEEARLVPKDADT
ncbi:MAG: diphthine--ammonia ligase [Candidatus Bathyarchaeota archaeon]|nr:MAG: diphthine--ammonia ligase [Candidatus Bathyarchaeota archaeon]